MIIRQAIITNENIYLSTNIKNKIITDWFIIEHLM
jgi:hypothetical protein